MTEEHVHHWHHEGCHHGPAIGEPECICGNSQPGYYCCGDDDGTECPATRQEAP